MWEAIRYVTGFASLAAFIAAVVVAYWNYRARQQTKWLEAIPDQDKARGLDAFLDRFHVDTSDLTRQQKFELVRSQIKNAQRRSTWQIGLFALIAVLLAGLWFIQITRDTPDSRSYTFEGFVVYEDSKRNNKEGAPVPEAEVKISGSELRDKTDATGKFTIAHVPIDLSVKEVVINHGGKPYTLQTKDFPTKVFRIPEITVVKSDHRPISPDDWKVVPATGCGPALNGKYPHTTQVSLTKDVHHEEDYSDVMLRIWCAEHIDIISARELAPSKGVKVRDEEDYTRAQKWQFPITGDTVRISVSLCLGATVKESIVSKADLHGMYWFEKVE